MLELIGVIATIIAITGVVLNNFRRREGFLVFMVSNTLALGIHLYVGVWSMAGRDAIFFILAIHGYVKWGQERRRMRLGQGGPQA